MGLEVGWAPAAVPAARHWGARVSLLAKWNLEITENEAYMCALEVKINFQKIRIFKVLKNYLSLKVPVRILVTVMAFACNNASLMP